TKREEEEVEEGYKQKRDGPFDPPPPCLRASPSSCFGKSMRLVLGNYFVEFEDREEHRDHDAADDHAQENDQHRLNQRGKGVEHRCAFFVPQIGHFLKHLVYLAATFSG